MTSTSYHTKRSRRIQSCLDSIVKPSSRCVDKWVCNAVLSPSFVVLVYVYSPSVPYTTDLARDSYCREIISRAQHSTRDQPSPELVRKVNQKKKKKNSHHAPLEFGFQYVGLACQKKNIQCADFLPLSAHASYFHFFFFFRNSTSSFWL